MVWGVGAGNTHKNEQQQGNRTTFGNKVKSHREKLQTKKAIARKRQTQDGMPNQRKKY